mgnify:CR=1 FL=1
MTQQAVKKDKNVLHFIVFCIIAAMGWVIPPVAPITVEGMRLLGIFVAAVYGWTVTSEIWPSLMTVILMPFTGLADLTTVLAGSWGGDTCLFIVLIMVLVAFLEATGTTAFIASYLMTRKMLAGHPWRLIFMLMLVAWVLSTLCGNMPGMFITWGFIYKICGILGYKPFDKFASLMVFGVAVMGAISLSTVPWNGNALVILQSYTQSTGNTINFAKLAAKGIPWNMIMMTVGICFVNLLSSQNAGIGAFLGKIFTPMFQGVSPVVFFILVTVITVALTNVMINMVVAVIMISATVPVAASLGIPADQVVYLITVSCTIAFLLPPASAASCVLFANTEWVRAKDVYTFAIPTVIMMAVVALGWNLILFMF